MKDEVVVAVDVLNVPPVGKGGPLPVVHGVRGRKGRVRVAPREQQAATEQGNQCREERRTSGPDRMSVRGRIFGYKIPKRVRIITYQQVVCKVYPKRAEGEGRRFSAVEPCRPWAPTRARRLLGEAPGTVPDWTRT